MTGQELVDLLEEHKGESYVLGAIAPKDKADYKGPWDCAEAMSWGLYQLLHKLYGCQDNNGNPATADAWTNWFKRDIENGTLIKISVDEAKATAGALLLRYTVGSRIGHIGCSKGTGGAGSTIEAMSTKMGFTNGLVDGRRWDCGILVPGMIYHDMTAIAVNGELVVSPYAGPAAVVLRLTDPMMKHPMVSVIGNELKKLGLYTKKVDDTYGEGMFKGVCKLQESLGLIVDGEVVLRNDGEVMKALQLSIIN